MHRSNYQRGNQLSLQEDSALGNLSWLLVSPVCQNVTCYNATRRRLILGLSFMLSVCPGIIQGSSFAVTTRVSR